ncbi:Protein Hook -like protein [Ceratocystis fimbriata CBS 114723]|uniref:Protein Hook-like protein n=1 Tax=Ceratocystis fimbriata CBS 114723 TaxID=1035309 RepID=A0A2C5XDD6_9PEZI|nr:Protein Hook -like protein [Ceratocystis fimbriata CBS 114723]
MMPITLSVEEALVEWVNKGFHVTSPITSLADLVDGVTLSEILLDLDSSYDASDIDRDPTSCGRWLTKKRNLQSVHRALFRFIHREAPDIEVLSRLIDIRDISDNPTSDGIAQLLYITIAASFLGPDPEKYVDRLREPGRFTKNVMYQIQQIIMSQQETVQRETQVAKDAESLEAAALSSRDTALAHEEEKITLLGQLDLARKSHADTMTRLEHLQDSYEALRLEEARLQRELDVLRKITQDGASDSQIIKALEDKIKEQDELIANQESQVEDDRVLKTKLTNELNSLRQKSELAEQLDDELKELKYRMEELSRKANAAERYKQKLEGQQHLQREVQNLQFEKDQLQETLKEHERLILRNQALEKTLAEVRRLHSAAEGEVYELTTLKQTLEEDIRAFQHQLTLMEERKNHDERFISELQEQLNNGETRPTAHTPSGVTSGFSLEDELEDAGGSQPNLQLEISRLKAENTLLKKGLGGSSEASHLKEELEEERRKHMRLKEQHDEIMTKNALAEDQLSSLIQKAVDGGWDSYVPTYARESVLIEHYYSDEALKYLSDRLKKTTAELETERIKVEELERLVSDKERELLSARTDLSMVDKDALQGLEELKAADELISNSLRTELEAARIRHTNNQDDLDHHRRQLIEALLAKDRYRKEVEELRANPEMGHVEGAVAESTKKANEKVEKLRDRLKQRQTQLEKAELEKHELQRKLKAALDGEALAEQKASYEAIIKNLLRENALVTTAWYDINSRVQSSHVVVQRRQDTPHSWINKQRHMVNNATPRR